MALNPFSFKVSILLGLLTAKKKTCPVVLVEAFPQQSMAGLGLRPETQ